MKNLLLLLLLPLFIYSVDYEAITKLEWMGPEDQSLERYQDYLDQNPYQETNFELIHRFNSGFKGPLIGVFVETSLYSRITSSISTYISDLQNEGYDVLLYTCSGSTPSDNRNLLAQLYANSSMEGAIFVGNLPAPFYQTDNDFNDNAYDEWPCDLYYMDIDGYWGDTLQRSGSTLIPGTDGIYDTHSGNVAPEIYLGRILPNLSVDDSIIITDYFTRNHSYRTNPDSTVKRALFFIDDDWVPWRISWQNALSSVYDSIISVYEVEITRADTYSLWLDSVFEWVSLFAHSWPAGHGFYYNSQVNMDYFYATGYTSKNPPSRFYNFFCCSFADYTVADYGTGRAVFSDNGLCALGSTKSGSMLEFDYFYTPLSTGKSVGQSFLDWFNYIAIGGFTQMELSWHYGMALIGDPSLEPDLEFTGIIDIPQYSQNENTITPLIYNSHELELMIKSGFSTYDCMGKYIDAPSKTGIYFLKSPNGNINKILLINIR